VAGLLLLAWHTPARCDKAYTADMLFPQIGQQGTTVDVTVFGTCLEHPEDVLFYESGIRCLEIAPVSECLDLGTGSTRSVPAGKAVHLKLAIAQDAVPGEHQLRLRTKDNLTELLTFWVTPYPVIPEVDPWRKPSRNDSSDGRYVPGRASQVLPLNCTVAGLVPPGLTQDYDWYAVDCNKGQRLSIEIAANRLCTVHNDGLNDPSVIVFDPDGLEIASNDDNALFVQDPVLSMVASKDGRYTIHVRQQMDYETGVRHYVMHVGTFPRPLTTFPLGGRAGRKVSVTLLGDALGDQAIDVVLPSSPGPFESAFLPVANPEGARPPTPNRIHVADFDDVFEKPGHNDASNPQPVSEPLPLAINGRISAAGEIDWYRIHATKGKRYRVHTYAAALGSELDPIVWLRPADRSSKEKSYEADDTLWDHHEHVGHFFREQIKDRLDAVFVFEPKSDGEWLLGITDTRREAGPRHVYRIELQPHADSAFVYFPAYPAQPKLLRDRIVLYRGQTYARPVGVQAGIGTPYRGLLQLRAAELPPGVTMDSAPFSVKDRVISVTFKADATAPTGAWTTDLMIEPIEAADRGGFRGGFSQVIPCFQQRGGFAMSFTKTRKMALAVVGPAPFDLRIDQPRSPLVRNGELPLTVHVTRRDGFTDAVYCEMDWLPQGINKQPPLIIPADSTSGRYSLRASGNAPLGEYELTVTGRENSGGNISTGAGFHYVSAPTIRLAVSEPYVTLALPRAAIERGTSGSIVARVEHHRPFKGTATLALSRLPFGVSQVPPLPVITSDDSTADFRVHVSEEALVGQYRDIVCDVLVTDEGRTVQQQTGSGVLRVDPERK
jgi:hypothetical protein